MEVAGGLLVLVLLVVLGQEVPVLGEQWCECLVVVVWWW
jgi:hypothetical protein